MKFHEAVEIVNRGFQSKKDSWNKARSFKVSKYDKSPKSVYEIEKTHPEMASVLRKPEVRKTIGKYLNQIDDDNMDVMDISLNPMGEVVIKDENGGVLEIIGKSKSSGSVGKRRKR